MKKKLLALGVAAALSTNAMAVGTLTLVSQGESSSVSQITVECGQSRASEHDTHLPIPANGQKQINYFFVSLLGQPLYCDFFDTSAQGVGKDIGTAQLAVSPDLSTATVVSYENLDKADYNVDIKSAHLDPLPVNTPAVNLTVTLSRIHQ